MNSRLEMSQSPVKCWSLREEITPIQTRPHTETTPNVGAETSTPHMETTPQMQIIPETEDIEEIEESAADRQQRENAESERLAWEMMQEESAEAYRIQMEYMQQNSEQISAEDYSVMQMLINESGMAQVENGGEEEGEDLNEEEADQSNPDNWDYDRLVALGQEIGDVKQERWRRRAGEAIKTLQKGVFKSSAGSQCSSVKKADESFETCTVCMEVFAETDDCYTLPCRHFFHDHCAEKWIADHNSCPVCKSKIVPSP